MDRIVINFNESEPKSVEFDPRIKVKPYISSSDQLEMIGAYLMELFADVVDMEYNHSRAENALIVLLLERQTNVKIYNDEESEALVSMDGIFSNMKFIDQIEKSIVNYSNFKMRLLRAVQEKKERILMENTLPSTIRNIYNSVQTFLNKITEEGISEEESARIKDLLKTVENSPILQESIKIFKNQEVPKSE